MTTPEAFAFQAKEDMPDILKTCEHQWAYRRRPYGPPVWRCNKCQVEVLPAREASHRDVYHRDGRQLYPQVTISPPSWRPSLVVSEDTPDILKTCQHEWEDIGHPNPHRPTSWVRRWRCNKCRVEMLPAQHMVPRDYYYLEGRCIYPNGSGDIYTFTPPVQ
jgi:ribosomal protein L37AE/L43A